MSTDPALRAPPPRPAPVALDALWVSVLACVAVLVPWWLGRRFGVDIAVGPDAPLWAASALDRLHGVGTAVPPLYGLLAAGVSSVGVPAIKTTHK